MRLFFVRTLFVCSMNLYAMSVSNDVNVETDEMREVSPRSVACITQYISKYKPECQRRITLHAYPSGVAVEERIHCEGPGRINTVSIGFMNYAEAEKEYGPIKRPHEPE